MKVKFIKSEALNENALYGAMGGGFDSTLFPTSYGVQGQNGPGYVYRVLTPDDSLQQKPNKVDDRFYIHSGSKVRGVGVNNPDLYYTGMVYRIVKNSDGTVSHLIIKTDRTNKFVTVRADDNLELIVNTPEPIETNFKMYTSNNMRLK
jgi:hypothetical protein